MDETKGSALAEISPELQGQLAEHVSKWSEEVRELLPSLPEDLDFVFDNQYLIKDTGTGGFTMTKRMIALSFDPNFQGNKVEQLLNLKATVFHENYHVLQGFTGEDYEQDIPAINNAIYEGAATVFERDRAKSNPPWGEYSDRQTIVAWVKEVKMLPEGYDWRKYKFYDSETDRRWIMYKVGTFVADEALRNHPELKIEDLANKKPEEILALANF